MQMQNLNGKVAVVTGAASSIREAAARLLVAEGVTVVLTARRRDRIDTIRLTKSLQQIQPTTHFVGRKSCLVFASYDVISAAKVEQDMQRLKDRLSKGFD